MRMISQRPRSEHDMDILIHLKTKEDHEVHLKLVLELMKKERLYAKFSKCEFWLQEVHFLGHVVNPNSIHMDLSKIKVAKNWKAPTTPSKIQSFLGLASYYRHFIENLSKIAKPLTSLTQKNKKYEWGVCDNHDLSRLVKPLVATYEFVVMYGLCVYMRYVDYVRVGNQSIECDRLIGIGFFGVHFVHI
ncbi:hypothetical protein Tco_1190509 [Tanacetum coccineum]